MKILVTGGAGFIGSHLATRLHLAGHEICLLDVQADELTFSGSFAHVVGSVLDSDLVDRLVRDSDLVCHLAGIPIPLEYVIRPKLTIEVNLHGSLNVVKSASQYHVPLVFSSTSEIYGRNSALPWTEDSDRVLGSVSESRWCYATSKAAVEHYIHACGQVDNLDFAIVRLFNVYGPGLTDRVVSRFVDQALRGEPLEIHGIGSQKRCFTYISDAIDAFIKIILAPALGGRTYNVGNPSSTNIRDLAELILELCESSSDLMNIPYESFPSGFVDIPDRIPSIDRIRHEFGWEPLVDLRAGLLMTIQSRNWISRDGLKSD
ncbi:MAG: NAD-dependent epimerase/dehydratase family protein [Chloracidobacterium sp.]|nr:NAD-dependent epimerase/dehydratase family protein [Chloracidobacterium sp.]